MLKSDYIQEIKDMYDNYSTLLEGKEDNQWIKAITWISSRAISTVSSKYTFAQLVSIRCEVANIISKDLNNGSTPRDIMTGNVEVIIEENVIVDSIEDLDAEPMFNQMPKFEDTILGNELKEEMVNNAYALVSSYNGIIEDQYSDFLDNLTKKIIVICNANRWDRNTYIQIVSKILHM